MKKFSNILVIICFLGFSLGIWTEGSGAELGSVSGKVLYNGHGIGGIKVFLVTEAEAAKIPYKIPDTRVVVGKGGLTDQYGNYKITGVPPGRYRVFVFDEHASPKYLGRLGFWGAIGEEVLTVGNGVTKAQDISLIAHIRTQSPGNGVIIPNLPLEFSWEPCSGAASYTLSLFDSNGKLLYEQVDLTETKTKVNSGLAPGRVYTWQITAYNRDKEMIGESLFPPEKRMAFILGQPKNLPVLKSLKIGTRFANGKLQIEKTKFSPMDENVYIVEEWVDVDQEHVVVAKFFAPSGEQFHELRSIIKPSKPRTWQEIDIAGHKPAETPGLWKIEVWLDGELLDTRTFEIQE